MAQVLDFSAGFPGGLNIARPRDGDGQQRYIGAVRYIGLPDRRKCTTRGELEDFSRAGLGMALVFEEAAGNWRKGFQQGEWDGQRARNHATVIGFPVGRPIYMAIDEDVVTVGEFAAMLDYLRGAHGPLGGPRLTGVYGEADVVDRARNAGVATWIWQTKAWSRGRLAKAHLRQLIGTVTVGGIACDVNDVLAEDWGQHNYVEDAVTPEQERRLLEDVAETRRLMEAFNAGATEYLPPERKNIGTWAAELRASQANTEAGVTELKARPGADVHELAAALGPLVSTGATPEQMTAAVALAFSRLRLTTEGNTP